MTEPVKCKWCKRVIWMNEGTWFDGNDYWCSGDMRYAGNQHQPAEPSPAVPGRVHGPCLCRCHVGTLNAVCVECAHLHVGTSTGKSFNIPAKPESVASPAVPQNEPETDYRNVRFCPFCGDQIWGEGSNPETGERFFSHTSSKKCYAEISLKVSGKGASLAVPQKVSEQDDKARVLAEQCDFILPHNNLRCSLPKGHDGLHTGASAGASWSYLNIAKLPASPAVPESQTGPIPADLRESYEILCKQTPKHPAIPLYERIARAEASGKKES